MLKAGSCLHNLTSGFSPQRSHHHLPSLQPEAFEDPREGRLLGGNIYKWVFVSQGCFTMVQVMGLEEGAYSGVSEAKSEFQSLTGSLKIRSVQVRETTRHLAIHRTALRNKE